MSVRPRLAGSAAGLADALTVGIGAPLTSITAAIVTEETGAYALLGMMLVCTAIALVAALYVLRVDRIEASECPEGADGLGATAKDA